jgi:hypothetical protein
MYRKTRATGFPARAVMTVSAPNYPGVYYNKGAIFQYEPKMLRIQKFNSVPPPYWLLGSRNAFTWSLPFVSEKREYLLFIFLASSPVDVNQLLVWSLR